MKILGIDPGLRKAGYALIEASGNRMSYLDSGVMCYDKINPFLDRLGIIFQSCHDLSDNTSPDEIAIERVFVHRNADSALKLGQARAAALCATFSAQLPVHEYAARHIKKAVVGKGSAEKSQVQHMVRMLLGLREAPGPDAADALAAALCHAQERGAQALIKAVAAGS